MFKLSIDKNYYKPILVKSGYNGNYIQYESKGDKILTLKECLRIFKKGNKLLQKQRRIESTINSRN